MDGQAHRLVLDQCDVASDVARSPMKSLNIVRRSSYAIGSGFGFAGTGSRANGIIPPEMSGCSPCL